MHALHPFLPGIHRRTTRQMGGNVEGGMWYSNGICKIEVKAEANAKAKAEAEE